MMTAFDIAIIALAVTSLISLLRYRQHIKTNNLFTPLLFLSFAIVVLGVFYLADLYIMWVLPMETGVEGAMAKMQHLHLELGWYKSLIMISGMFAGILLVMRRLINNSQNLEQLNTALDKRLLKLNQLSTAVNTSSSAIIFTNADDVIEFVNPGFEEYYGYSSEEVVGRHYGVIRPNDPGSLNNPHIAAALERDRTWKGVLQNRRKDGSTGWERTNITAIVDDEDRVTYYISIIDDITREHEITEQLNYQAKYDHLTGLENRFEFDQQLARLLQKNQQSPSEHALCYIDLDQFKIINDTCGHTAGDELLKLLAVLLSDCTHKNDILARLGGDEFGWLMPCCSQEQAEERVQLALKAVQNFQFAWEDKIFRIGMSVGLVPINDNKYDLTTLMKNADTACYIAKDAGRNRCHIYHEADSREAEHEGEMHNINNVYKALSNDSFVLYAQLISPLHTGAGGNSYELLLRARDDQGEIIFPGEFLPAAERFNLIGTIDRLVLKKALAALVDNPEFLQSLHYVSINLSGQTVADKQFLDYALKAIKDCGVDASKICFEITETAAISNLNAAKTLMKELSQQGCHFALDDFGSGLSSFAYLKHMPVDIVKIDGLFVRDIAKDPIDRAMVKSINEVARVMGMSTVAEFVESHEIRTLLRTMGVDYVQGYAIEEPKPLEELLQQGQKPSSESNSPQEKQY